MPEVWLLFVAAVEATYWLYDIVGTAATRSGTTGTTKTDYRVAKSGDNRTRHSLAM